MILNDSDEWNTHGVYSVFRIKAFRASARFYRENEIFDLDILNYAIEWELGDCYSDLDDRQTYFQGRELKQLVPIYVNVARFYLLLVNTLLMFFYLDVDCVWIGFMYGYGDRYIRCFRVSCITNCITNVISLFTNWKARRMSASRYEHNCDVVVLVHKATPNLKNSSRMFTERRRLQCRKKLYSATILTYLQILEIGTLARIII